MANSYLEAQLEKVRNILNETETHLRTYHQQNKQNLPNQQLSLSQALFKTDTPIMGSTQGEIKECWSTVQRLQREIDRSDPSHISNLQKQSRPMYETHRKKAKFICVFCIAGTSVLVVLIAILILLYHIQ